MKFFLLIFSLLTAIPTLAKTNPHFSYSVKEKSLSEKSTVGSLNIYFLPTFNNNSADFFSSDTLIVNTDSLLVTADTVLIVKDTLIAIRHFLTTSIFKDGRSLSRSAIIGIYQSTPESISKYRWGTALIPAGTVIAVAGIAFGYIAVKGEPATEMVRGIRTPTDSSPPDVQVNYTKRSVPAILAGLGLFAGGMCLLELSNELIGKSANVYNAKLKESKKVSFIYKARLGITPSGNLGICAWIK